MAASTFLSVAVVTVEQLFSSHMFGLPWFQRAYAWSDSHVGRLLTDVVEAMDSAKPHYWLGHVFLATNPARTEVSIIDGHQRSVTLTMICAILRDQEPGSAMRDRLHRLIGERDTGSSGSGLRLNPQPSVSDFFHAWVQRPGATLTDPEGDILDLSEGERSLLNNRDHLRQLLRELLPRQDQRTRLAAFLLAGCHLTVEICNDEEEAWSLVATEEETGLDFHSSERAKISLITAMPRDEQEEASHMFQRALSAVGPDGMTLLLSHIRALKVRRRSTKPVEREILERFGLDRSGLAFMRDELVPRAETMAQITRLSLGDEPLRPQTEKWLETLFWLPHQMWMPAALQWVAVMGENHPETPKFFARLDRLAYMMKIAGVDPTEQERRFIRLTGEIDRRLPVDDIALLDIDQSIKTSAIENLRSRSFYSKRFHALVLRRIAWNVGPERDPGPVDGNTVTVEHVLPRRPPKDRHWWKAFPSNTSVVDHCHKLGNLVFLSLHENHLAGTSDYVVKRLLLAQAGSRFVLAASAAQHNEWTPAVIMARTETMIAELLGPWQLDV